MPRSFTLLLGVSMLLVTAPLQAADPAAAERQYRIARRLIAEGSAEAKAALEKVIELDPAGELADDATVERALLLGAPRWPEELGRIEIFKAQEALELVGWVARELSGSDRALQARYLRALLLLEPLPFHDASDARLGLITVATARDEMEWTRAARYATGWLAEQQGKEDRAEAAYQRLVIDAPGSEAAARAMLGISRLMLGRGRFGEAADLLQQAIDGEAPVDTGAAAMRELAVRSLLGRIPGAGGGVAAGSTGTSVRSPACVAATPDGGLLLGDQKNDEVRLLDLGGGIRLRWSLEDIQAVAVSSTGRAFAAAGDSIYRLDVNNKPLRIASQGELGPASALAVDGVGRLWLLDRRGERIGRLEPGGPAPIVVAAADSGGRLAALAWDGRRIISVDPRARVLVEIGPEGARRVLAASGMQKPIDVAVNAAGGIAVLDSRADTILFFDAQGSRLGSLPWSAAGISKAVAVLFAPDGALLLVDGSDAVYVRVP